MSSPPSAWVLLGSAAGDNAQALRLAEAVGIPFSLRSLVVKPECETAKPPVRGSLEVFDINASAPLQPPWPALVITVGRHLSMAALWVKKQSHGRTKIVLLGRPKGQVETFDLIVASVDQRVPERSNLCRIGLPLFAIDPGRLGTAAAQWRARLAHLKRPITAVLVGGASRRYGFSAEAARCLVAQIEATRTGGSLYISTSRRTPDAAGAAIGEVLPHDSVFYRWRANDPDNPYLGLLALADRFVVTGDSISMLVEIARLGKPLAIAPMGYGASLSDWLPDSAAARQIAKFSEGLSRRLVWPLIGTVSATAPWRRPRDIGAVHRFLYDGGWAVRLGQPFVTPKELPPDDTAMAASRVRALVQ